MATPQTHLYDTALLDRFARVTPQTRLLDLGYYDPAGALWAAEHGAAVTALRPSIDLIVELDLAARHRRVRVDARLATSLGSSDWGSFDAAFLIAPFFLGNTPVRNAIDLVSQALTPAGTLLYQAHRRHGADTFMKYARERFERVDQVGIGTHQCRLFQATGPIPATASAATTDPIEHVLTVRQTSIRLQLGAGVFGARGIDPGTTFLLQTAEIPAGVSVLDLGCGAGAIGIHLASEDRRRRVVMTDVSQAAVELASANAARNNLDRVRVLVSDGFAAIARERFEVILSNLPAHRGPVDDPSLAEGLIRDAAAHLTEDGNAWFVVNRSRGIELTAARAFRHVEIAAQNARYKVVRCASPRPTRSTRHG